MIERIRVIGENFYYLFPIQLLVNHVKRNYVLLLCWLILFSIISGNFGNYLGIPYLFLDPVYLNKVSFSSFFIMGVVISGFSVAFHITTYINDGHRFSFIGVVSKPFTVFSLNNSVIPFLFLFTYVIYIIQYQVSNEYVSFDGLFINILGLICGYAIMLLALYSYFWFTNKDIFKYVVCKVDEKLKQNFKATRASAMKKLNIAKKKQIRVDHYMSLKFDFQRADEAQGFYDRNTILQVFDQNHFNLVIIELLILALLFVMGIFRDHEIFQLPAAASFVLFLTIFVMFAGAFAYWFGNWSSTVAVIMILSINLLVKEGIFNQTYMAYGLNYDAKPANYNLDRIDELTAPEILDEDKKSTQVILNNWRKKFPADEKPKMVFLCVSGGGQRAALWTLHALQQADSLTGGDLMKHTMLITGASGGLIGASYYRELYLRQQQQKICDLYSKVYFDSLGSDNLNAVIFSLLMNDTFVGFQDFNYKGQDYSKDRGYAFEQQLNRNTGSVLDKPISAYKAAETSAQIPMLILAPTIINDGRKLYISPQHVSYMMDVNDSIYHGEKINGIEFLRFFNKQSSDSLRFLSGLRMSATFPYITPNITLPSYPPMEIMDAGITDNFGISDAVRFLYAFKGWIAENTSGVVILSIRDSEKEEPIKKEEKLSLFEKFSLPISSIYQNFQSLQDITNDDRVEYAKNWFSGSIERIDIQYIPQEYMKENLPKTDSLRMENIKRASLSWRLTSREKTSLINTLGTKSNQNALKSLKETLESKPTQAN
ncbi:patatin-like phospholipase family protein [Fulvivirga ligni]|uniref:patatin-like phospholipase family protein n=1 Tax=Fulvivirga ligni TaxID=2904246 RepID=UPI001F337921|nr:patatin-like phospholipase family protein [Fulvivirga ligni]UII23794.1 patatin-like phospholipase family protein [Fulvivirga ligni]